MALGPSDESKHRPSPATRAQLERAKARAERAVAAKEAHLAWLHGGPLRDERLHAAEAHRMAADVSDAAADEIERGASTVPSAPLDDMDDDDDVEIHLRPQGEQRLPTT